MKTATRTPTASRGGRGSGSLTCSCEGTCSSHAPHAGGTCAPAPPASYSRSAFRLAPLRFATSPIRRPSLLTGHTVNPAPGGKVKRDVRLLRSTGSRSAPAVAGALPSVRGGWGALRGPPCKLIEHQHCAGDLAGLHRAEGVVDVLETATAGDHLVQAQKPSLVEVDVLRHVDLETVRAHAAALDALLPEEHAALELNLLADGDHADHGRGSARPDALEGLLGGFLEADRLEGVLDAAVGQLADQRR